MDIFVIAFGMACCVFCFITYCASASKVSKSEKIMGELLAMLDSAEKCADDLMTVAEGLRVQIREVDRQLGAVNEVLGNEEPG